MSQICLENIVSVRDVCAEQVIISSSGYDLMDAPEIDIAKINDIANAEYNTGLKILKNCVRLALRDWSYYLWVDTKAKPPCSIFKT